MRAPPMETYLQWIIDAWDQLPKQLIIDSFKGCGLTTALDGSEDKKIHCFKPDGSIPTGQALLQQKRNEKAIVELIEQIDIEQDEENEDEYGSDASIDI